MTTEKKTVYDKLIRDHVPAIMDGKRVRYQIHALDEGRYRLELFRKVQEEAVEITGDLSRERLIEEMCDLRAVLEAICELEGIERFELDEAFLQNMTKKGGFRDRIFLEWTRSDD